MTEESNLPATQKVESGRHGNERLVAFSDGVFAITITLLVLEIKVPEIAHDLVAKELPAALLHLSPKILSYFLSFIVLGMYWIAHHNMFMHIKRHNHVLLWLNNLFILCTACLPFPTGLLGEYPDQQIAIVIFGITLFFTGLVLNIIWWYATTHRLVDEQITPEFVAFVHRYIRIAPILYLASIGVSFVSLAVSKLIFVLVAVIYIFPNPFHYKHYKQLLSRFDK